MVKVVAWAGFAASIKPNNKVAIATLKTRALSFPTHISLLAVLLGMYPTFLYSGAEEERC